MWTQGLGGGEGVDVGIDGPGLGCLPGSASLPAKVNCTLRPLRRSGTAAPSGAVTFSPSPSIRGAVDLAPPGRSPVRQYPRIRGASTTAGELVAVAGRSWGDGFHVAAGGHGRPGSPSLTRFVDLQLSRASPSGCIFCFCIGCRLWSAPGSAAGGSASPLPWSAVGPGLAGPIASCLVGRFLGPTLPRRPEPPLASYPDAARLRLPMGFIHGRMGGGSRFGAKFLNDFSRARGCRRTSRAVALVVAFVVVIVPGPTACRARTCRDQQGLLARAGRCDPSGASAGRSSSPSDRSRSPWPRRISP